MKKISRCIGILMLMLLPLTLIGCSGNRSGGEEAAAAETEAADTGYGDMTLSETLSAKEAGGTESPYYGFIKAVVLDINGSGDSGTIYTFSDKNDPDNAWSCSRYELLDIETDINAGDDVVILFNGDLTGDYDEVSFLVVVPDGSYEMRRAEGVTTSNLMSTFGIRTDDGEEISFLKDNCWVDDGALSADSGDRVIVYYADGGEEGRFPLRVYRAD